MFNVLLYKYLVLFCSFDS